MLRKTSGKAREPVDDVIQFAGADTLENEAQAIIDRALKMERVPLLPGFELPRNLYFPLIVK